MFKLCWTMRWQATHTTGQLCALPVLSPLALFWVWERQTSSTDPTAGQLCVFFSLAFFSFLETVHEQPTWSTLQNDWGMYAGQSLLTIGAFLLLICLARFGVWDTFVRIGTVCLGTLLSPCWIDTHSWVKCECNVSGWLWSGLSQLGECSHYHDCGIMSKFVWWYWSAVHIELIHS